MPSCQHRILPESQAIMRGAMSGVEVEKLQQGQAVHMRHEVMMLKLHCWAGIASVLSAGTCRDTQARS